MHSLERLPSGLPPPVDDGGSRHLPGMTLPHCRLASTQGDWIDPAAIAGRIVIYCYPMTGRPGVALPDGWDQIPGARGCTAQRLHLPFALLSDADYQFTDALRLPTFEADGRRLNKRITLIARDGRIEHCFYPVFPPDRSSEQVLDWLRRHG